jgi:hypothetical protein
MQSDLGEDFAKVIAADPSHIKRLFPRIKEAGTEAILTSCRKAVAGNEIFQALNSVGASQKAIDAAVAFDLETQSVYSLIERGLQFSRADALAQHHAITLAARFATNSASRAAASGPVWESAAIKHSTKSPSASLMSWMRGSACSTQRMVSGAIADTFAASSSALDFASPSGTRYCTSPARAAAAASRTRLVSIRLVRIMSTTREAPCRRATYTEAPPPT